MCNNIQTKEIKSSQYKNNNTSMSTSISDVNKVIFENKVEPRNTNIQILNKINVKDIKKAPIDPNSGVFFELKKVEDDIKDNNLEKINNVDNKDLLVANQHNIIDKPINVEDSSHLKSVMLLQLKNLYETYKGQFSRVLKGSDLSDINRILMECIESKNLPTGQNLNRLKELVEKLKVSDNFLKEFTGDLNNRKSFIACIYKMLDNAQNGMQLEAKYIDTSNKVNTKISEVRESIRNSPNKDNKLISSLDLIMMKYQEALASGDKHLIILYSGLMDKILDAIHNNKSGDFIADIMEQYNKLVEKMYDENYDQGKLQDEIREFFGEETFNLFMEALLEIEPNSGNTDVQGGGGINVAEVGNRQTNITNNSNKKGMYNGQNTQGGGKFKPFDLLRAKAAKDPSTKPFVFEPTVIVEIKKMTSNDVKKVIESSGLKEKLKELKDLNKELIQIQIELQKFNESIVKPLQIINKKDDDYISKNIKESIRKIIEKVEKMELELDLEVKQEGVTIVTLLQKFREIIKQLDLDSRSNIKKVVDAYLIDQKNQNYIRDMDLRWKSLDKTREMVNKLFDEIKEKHTIKN